MHRANAHMSAVRDTVKLLCPLLSASFAAADRRGHPECAVAASSDDDVVCERVCCLCLSSALLNAKTAFRPQNQKDRDSRVDVSIVYWKQGVSIIRRKVLDGEKRWLSATRDFGTLY